MSGPVEVSGPVEPSMTGRANRWPWWAPPALAATALVAALVVGIWIAVSGSSGSGSTSPAAARAALRARSEAGSLPTTGGPLVGSRPPVLSVPSLEPGQPPISLTALRGKPVVVNFFASWCQPCLAELPRFARAWERVGSRVAFLGVDVNDSSAHALALLRADRVGYPVGADPEDATALRLHLVGLPTTVFIGADGRVVETHTGQVSAAGLDRGLARLVTPSG